MPKDQPGVHVSRVPKADILRGRSFTPSESPRFELQDEIDRVLEHKEKEHDQDKLILLMMQQQKFMTQTMNAMQGDIKKLQGTVTWLRDRVILLCAGAAGGGFGLSKGLDWLFGG